jgi:hypothetical protein
MVLSYVLNQSSEVSVHSSRAQQPIEDIQYSLVPGASKPNMANRLLLEVARSTTNSETSLLRRESEPIEFRS